MGAQNRAEQISRIRHWARKLRVQINPGYRSGSKKKFFSDLTHPGDWISFLVPCGVRSFTRCMGRVRSASAAATGSDTEPECVTVSPCTVIFDPRHGRFVWTQCVRVRKVRVHWSHIICTLGRMINLGPTPYTGGRAAWVASASFEEDIQSGIEARCGRSFCDDRALQTFLERYPALALSGAYR